MTTKTPLAYLITFTCYGTRLHGSVFGSVDEDHNAYGADYLRPDTARMLVAKKLMKHSPYRLDARRRTVVLGALRQHCEQRSWKLLAVHVRSTHIHFVVAADEKPEIILNQVKAYSSRALNRSGFDDRCGSRWTLHGSTRYIWKPEHVRAAMSYVARQQGPPMAVWEIEDPEPLFNGNG